MKAISVFLAGAILTFGLDVLSSETTPETGESTEQSERIEEPAVEKIGTRILREQADYFALANYSPLDLLIPGKIGITLGLVANRDRTWELEYLRGSLSVPYVVGDLGGMVDERVSLIGRSYFGSNSFNFGYGLSYFNFSVHLGNRFLNGVTGGSYPSIDVIKVQAFGLNVSLGNRWALNHRVTLGVDWVSWAQPLVVTQRKSDFLDYTSNQQDRDDVDKAIKLVSHFPRLAFLKLQLGILF